MENDYFIIFIYASPYEHDLTVHSHTNAAGLLSLSKVIVTN